MRFLISHKTSVLMYRSTFLEFKLDITWKRKVLAGFVIRYELTGLALGIISPSFVGVAREGACQIEVEIMHFKIIKFLMKESDY